MTNGQLQYRFDCGGGEGAVLVPEMQFNDDRWHNVMVKRFGNRAEVLVDGSYGAQVRYRLRIAWSLWVHGFMSGVGLALIRS